MNLHYRTANGEDKKLSAKDEAKWKAGSKLANQGKKTNANQPTKLGRQSKGKR